MNFLLVRDEVSPEENIIVFCKSIGGGRLEIKKQNLSFTVKREVMHWIFSLVSWRCFDLAYMMGNQSFVGNLSRVWNHSLLGLFTLRIPQRHFHMIL